jgi:hypothetical protein
MYSTTAHSHLLTGSMPVAICGYSREAATFALAVVNQPRGWFEQHKPDPASGGGIKGM